MRRDSIKPWMIWGGLFILIYIILTIYSFAYGASYDPKYDWDFGGLVPLLFTNFPGILAVFGLFNLLDIKADTYAARIAFWTILVGANVLFYFGVGASIGMVWEMIRKFTRRNDQKVTS
jgi:hypothetical protein